MGKGRNEELINSFEVKRKARKKAIKDTLIVLFIAICLFAIVGFLGEGYKVYQIIGISIPILALCILNFLLLDKVYKDQEVYRLEEIIVEKCLTSEEYTQVIPIKADDYEDFILGLQDHTSFFAIMHDENFVDVFAKIDGEDDLRYCKSISKGYFLDYYKIQEYEE